jgi:hypothetical protein
MELIEVMRHIDMTSNSTLQVTVTPLGFNVSKVNGRGRLTVEVDGPLTFFRYVDVSREAQEFAVPSRDVTTLTIDRAIGPLLG